MTNLSEILKGFFEEDTCEFHREVLNAYMGKKSIVAIQKDLVDAINSFTGTSVEDLESFLYTVCFPGPVGVTPQQALHRKKKLINTFWKKQNIIDITGCDVSMIEKIKVYRRGEELVAVSFGDSQSGQFGEFSSPIIDKKTMEVINEATKDEATRLDILKDLPLKIHIVLKTKKGFVEILPIGFLGVKTVPITLKEESLKEAVCVNDGTFSSELVSNAQYERLVIEGCAFAPLFSKGTKTKFDVNMFTSKNIITTNRLQKTLKAIKREAEKLKLFPESPLAWTIINEENLESSLFSDKVGLFVTTTVGESIITPPIVGRSELIVMIVDALWTVEQAIENKIYLTDLNIGNILYYDMKPIAEICGYPSEIPTAREYHWDPKKNPQAPPGPTLLRVFNTYTRLVFVDLGTSYIEKPSFGNKKVIDSSPPMTRDSRMEMQAICREDVISALMYCIVVNGGELDLINAVGNLNVSKNLFFQFLPLTEEVVAPEDTEVSEKYVAKVFR